MRPTFAEFFGDGYNGEPLPSKEDLERHIKSLASTLDTMTKRQNHPLFIEDCQKQLEEVLTEYNNNRYIVTAAEKDYLCLYEDKWNQYCDLYAEEMHAELRKFHYNNDYRI